MKCLDDGFRFNIHYFSTINYCWYHCVIKKTSSYLFCLINQNSKTHTNIKVKCLLKPEQILADYTDSFLLVPLIDFLIYILTYWGFSSVIWRNFMALNVILAELSGDDSFPLYFITIAKYFLRGRILPESALTLGWWPKLYKLSKIFSTLALPLSSQVDTPAMSPVHPYGRTGHKLGEEVHTYSGNTPQTCCHPQGDFPDSWSVSRNTLNPSCTYWNDEKSHQIPENLMILQCWKQLNLFWECWLFIGKIKN